MTIIESAKVNARKEKGQMSLLKAKRGDFRGKKRYGKGKGQKERRITGVPYFLAVGEIGETKVKYPVGGGSRW